LCSFSRISEFGFFDACFILSGCSAWMLNSFHGEKRANHYILSISRCIHSLKVNLQNIVVQILHAASKPNDPAVSMSMMLLRKSYSWKKFVFFFICYDAKFQICGII